MRLTDLLQLIDDLNLNTSFYLKIAGKTMPWGKLTLAGEKCLLYPGQKALTKKKIVRELFIFSGSSYLLMHYSHFIHNILLSKSYFFS